MKRFECFVETFSTSAQYWPVHREGITIVGIRSWDVKEWKALPPCEQIRHAMDKLPELLMHLKIGRMFKRDYASVLFVLDKMSELHVHTAQGFMDYMDGIGYNMERLTSADDISKVYRTMEHEQDEMRFMGDIAPRTEKRRKYIAYIFLQLLLEGY